MTKRLGRSLSIPRALGITWLVVAMFFLPTERWTSLPISDALAEDQLQPNPPDWDSDNEPCIDGIKSLQALYHPKGPIPEPGPFVIGCKLADCGPGTDGPGPIDLRITLAGDLVERTILEFENMTAQDAARIGVRGNGRHAKGTTRFEVRSGITVLRGFGTNPKLRPPVAIPHLTLNRKALEAFKQAAKGDDLLANSKSPVTFVIEQFRGRVTVNRYAVRDHFKFCLPPRPPIPDGIMGDRVDFGTVLPDKVTVLAPGRVEAGFSGCKNYAQQVYEDQPSAGATTVKLKNHLQDEMVLQVHARTSSTSSHMEILHRCHSEVVVYGKFNALAVVQPVIPPWTDPIVDKVPVTLRNPLEVPVTVWILYDPDGGATDDVRGEIPLATEAFLNRAECGIAFHEPWVIHKIGQDISFPPGMNPDYFLILDPGDAVVRLRQEAHFYTAGTLNVYIIQDPVSNAGVTVHATNDISCSTAPGPGCDEYGDMILIRYDIERDTTLAHEIGHTLSLEHVDGISGFDSNNLMWSGSNVMEDVTKGQCYRAHVDHSSYLNTDGVRAAGLPTLRNCPRDGNSEAICPDLSFGPP